MLHIKSVEPATLELLKSLQQKKYFEGFYLVGGTALALYYGYRHSEDIDLFSNDYFDAGQLLEQIRQDFSYQLYNTVQNTLKGSISGVNVDVIAIVTPTSKAQILLRAYRCCRNKI
ncbi:MAG TPA: nucleotidyl transferase AbiEii/AbiGii toxin family protein [Fodinibius sp.]|nr:nucleotidyl transferase AbiEii/AbiGii toxin family protein [Fodinibius sp.]